MLQNPCDPKNIKFPCDAVGLLRIGDYELFPQQRDKTFVDFHGKNSENIRNCTTSTIKKQTKHII